MKRAQKKRWSRRESKEPRIILSYTAFRCPRPLARCKQMPHGCMKCLCKLIDKDARSLFKPLETSSFASADQTPGICTAQILLDVSERGAPYSIVAWKFLEASTYKETSGALPSVGTYPLGIIPETRESLEEQLRAGIVAVDFDGVLVTSKIVEDLTRTDSFVMQERVASWVNKCLGHGLYVYIVTARSRSQKVAQSVWSYLTTHGISVSPRLCVTNIKPVAHLYVDDRAMRYFPEAQLPPPEEIQHLAAWHKRGLLE